MFRHAHFVSEIAHEEWDFSECPDEQLTACHEYEIWREDKSFQVQARTHRAALGDPTFEQLLARWEHWQAPKSIAEADAADFFFYGPKCSWWLDEFPNEPFLCVPPAKRSAFADEEGNWGAIAWDFFELLNEFPELAEQAGGDDPPLSWFGRPVMNGSRTAGAFLIDWRRNDDELVRHFKAWLEDFRNKDILIRETRGAGSKVRKLRKELKALGAWRLLEKMPWSEAYLVTQEHLTKGLFSNHESAWRRARRVAENLIARRTPKELA